MTSREYPNEPGSVGRAREFVAQALAGLPADVRDSAVLLASELATNAIRHARSSFAVDVTTSDREVRVAVRDRGGAAPLPRNPTASDVSGRGLLIVRTLADDWGIDTGSDGLTVWFALRTSRHQQNLQVC